ncbi:MAG: S9 family peptidase [Alcaligenaceae bacterium]|nr:MAG: S9 family peptidase [Alcaligenaceae bacterium]
MTTQTAQATNSPASAPARTPFKVDDLYLHMKITELHCTARLQRAVCAVQSVDREKNDYQSKLWMYGLEDSEVLQITHGTGKDHSPCWAPDGNTLAFISDRDGSAQIYLLPKSGREAQTLGHFEGEVSSLRWTPDGRTLLVTATVSVNPNLRGRRPPPDAVPAAVAAGPAELAWKLPYKSDGVGYLLAREIHLFKVDVSTGGITQLTDGAFDVLAHGVSHDGQQLAYVRTREGRFAHGTDLWVCGPNGANHTRLTETHTHVMQPVWSPSDRYIAFTGSVLAGDAEVRLWLLDTTTGKTRQLGEVEVADPTSVHWTDGGDGIVFARAHEGRHEIARITLDGHMDVLLAKDHQLGAFGWTDKHYALALQHPSEPSELHVCSKDTCADSLRQVSDLNPWWKERTAIEAQSKWFEVPGSDGGTQQIQGWLIRAEGAPDGAPLLNDIHGGPASYALLDFDTSIYWQVLCSQGWSVLALNAVGSASFGHDFSHELEGHWGTYDMPQHLAAVELLKAQGICDDRLAICGKSYGGYLTAWTIGHTELFKAAIVMAPVGNIETHYGTSDGGYYADPFFMATAPRFDREKARRLSPLQHISNATTPTLFLQGKEDERCPKCQSEELFVTFICSGDNAGELVLYPNEGHDFLAEGAPACRADAAARIIDWLTQHTVNEHTSTSRKPPDL